MTANAISIAAGIAKNSVGDLSKAIVVPTQKAIRRKTPLRIQSAMTVNYGEGYESEYEKLAREGGMIALFFTVTNRFPHENHAESSS